ncbi:sensor histidine kinase [Paenibacillaceae bacterium]|nr:sensor histidine kinase [Paenibacillaceae bacterium]
MALATNWDKWPGNMREMNANRRLLFIALAAAIVCAGITYSFTFWMQAKLNTEYAKIQSIQTGVLLSSTYDLYGSWDQATEKLQSSPLLQGQQLQIWSVSNQLVWPWQNASPSRNAPLFADEAWSDRHPILLNGEIIGTFSGLSGREQLVFPYPLLLSISIGLLIGLVVYFVMQRQHAVHTLGIHRVSALLDSIRSRQTPSLSIAAAGMERIETSIRLIDEHLYRLETLRKSMVADIAHELRTPLTVLRAKLDKALLSQAALSLNEVVVLQDEVYRMSKLLGDLQQLALAESGHLQLEKRWFPVGDQIEQLTGLLAMEAEEDRIVIDYHNNDAGSLLYADENRIKQVLLNIMGNALRHARSKVSISLVSENYHCVITITDDGEGIEEEELPYLFDRFYRGTSSRRSQPAGSSPGSGLGLSIAKSLIEAHHGSITAASRWQEGTTFRITLPVINDSA